MTAVLWNILSVALISISNILQNPAYLILEPAQGKLLIVTAIFTTELCQVVIAQENSNTQNSMIIQNDLIIYPAPVLSQSKVGFMEVKSDFFLLSFA